MAFSITICTYQKNFYFDNDELANVIFRSLTDYIISHSNFYTAVLMKNHIHMLLSPTKMNLIDLLRNWKSYTTRRSWDYEIKGQLWQKGYYEHAIRGEKHLIVAALYILNNPVRAGIVKDYRNYPYYYQSW